MMEDVLIGTNKSIIARAYDFKKFIRNSAITCLFLSTCLIALKYFVMKDVFLSCSVSETGVFSISSASSRFSSTDATLFEPFVPEVVR